MSKTRKPRPASRKTARSTAPAAEPESPVAVAPADLAGDSPLPPGMTLVGVGASAGGLQAFTELIESIPADAGLTLVLVQHISPKHESALPTLLGSHTHMPVTQVIDGARLELNHVYVIPPNVQMQLVGNTLQLTPRPDDRSQHTPIDTFFSSLAEVARSRGVAVVLSGTAADGALGVRDVKAAGGITFAQQPESAKYDGMPRAAIATGMVDLVLTPQRIGAELGRIALHPYIRTARQSDDLGIHDDQLRRVFDLLRPASGVDFRHYKLPTIRRRLLRRMALNRLTEVEHYVRLLQSNPVELRGLFQDLLIHVTRFFREPESFQALGAEVLPTLFDERNPEHPFRVWVCGCATGEEAYSLAITLVEFLQKHQSEIRIQIFATDVSETAIEHARAGLYSSSITADVSAERLRRFFTKTDGHYRVSKVIRDMCVFARQDLTRDPPFSRLDLVMCRNVLIYMDTVLQKKLIALFHYALNPHGYLVLGQAETVGTQASLFSVFDKKHRIHRKKSGPGVLPTGALPVEYMPVTTQRKAPGPEVPADTGLQSEVSRLILDRYSPAGVVVDSEMQIVQFRGQTGTFLEPAPGEASLNVLKMAREGLLYGLRTALHNARVSKAPVRKDGLQVKAANGWIPVAIEVVPLGSAGRPHYLVLFEDQSRERPKEQAPSRTKKKTPKGRLSRQERDVELLQRELAASREYLQSIIHELEAANEELQSANEEILSSNEELQSTNEELDTAKEELQSTNEELNTVNEELQGRNEELSRVNSDLVNLVGSVQIAIVIVSSDLRIRRFTPMAEKVLNLIPADLDRSIAHINPNINCPNLEQLIIECMDAVSPIEREVQDRQGRWYALRIRPYKSIENKIDGAVLGLFDIDVLKRSEQRAERAGAFAESLLMAAVQPLALLEHDFRIKHANLAFARLFELRNDEVQGKTLAEIGGERWTLSRWTDTAAMNIGTTLPDITLSLDGGSPATLKIGGRIVPSPDCAEGSLVMLAVQ